MKRKINMVLILTIILLMVTLYFNSITYAIENNEYTTKKIALLKVPDSWDEVDDLNLSGFVFEVQLPDGETEVFDCSQINFDIDTSNSMRINFYSDKLWIWLYSDDTITFIFKEYKDLSLSFTKNDFRYYNLKNNSQTYAYTTDYEIANQTLFDINKEYPPQYDLRDKINIKVENQGGFGLCWDFSITKALETTYALKYGENIDLSEMYIDYITNVKNGRGDRELHNAGKNYTYYNEVIRSGICKEEDLPFSEEEVYDINDVKKCKSVVLPQSAFLIEETEISLNRNKNIVNKMIKEQLMNNGAVNISITFSQNHFNNQDFTFFLPTYCTQDNFACHAVTIIGWDDNFSKEKFKRHTVIGDNYEADIEPKEDGAWIVLNSWGDEYGDNGTFYLSYESDISTAFGFLDVIPYEERYEYSYVENEYKDYQTVMLNDNHKKYFYQEYRVKDDNDNITHITIANAVRGKVYYIDNYEKRDEINFDDKVFIGDFASSISPIRFNNMSWMQGTCPLKTNFVLDEPIKIKGDKFLIIVEIDGTYVNSVFLNKGNNIKTYYTDDELSTDWHKCTGNLPISVFTINRTGGILSESTSANNTEETKNISDNIILWISAMITLVLGFAVTIKFIKKRK